MRKFTFFFKTLLVATLLLGGANSAWAETITKTIYSWTFTGNANDETVTLDAETTLTENSTSCKLATAPANCAGLYFQTSGTDTNGWKCYKTTTGLRNLCGGNRMCIIPGLSEGDVISISCNSTEYITASKYSGAANGDKNLITYTMAADGNFWFQFQKVKAPDYPSLYSIKVTREVEAVSVSSWNFQTATWVKESGFGTPTVTINGQSCTYASGALEGLALQGGSGTGWTVNENGLTQGNGTRNLGILNLKAGDVVVVNTAATISSLVNGTSINDTYTGECKFSVTSDGTFGYSFDRNKYTTSIVVYRALSDAIAEYNDVKGVAEALRDVPNDNSAANSTLSSAITTQNAAVASATTYAQISTAKTALQNAVMAYIAAANPITGNQFDLTFLLTNPDLEGIVDWGDAAAQGWFTDIPRTGLGQYNNFAARTNQSKNCVERYTSDVYTTANTFGLYQKVTLPAGNYSFDAYALANNASNIVMAAGNTEGDAVTSGDFTEYSVDFTQASNSETKLGIKIAAEGTNAANWMAITGLKLYKEAPTSVTATISEYGWATFSSDYALDFSKATEGLEAYMITGHEGNVVTKSKVEGTVPAGTGLLLKGDAGDYTIPVVASSETNVSANKLVAGTGAEVSEGGDNTRYVLGVNNNGTAGDESDDFAEFQKIGGTAATVAKGKAYLEFVGVSLVKVFNIVDGAATGVEAPVAAEAAVEDGIYYNLNGQQVTKDYKGIVIVNGKKFYNK